MSGDVEHGADSRRSFLRTASAAAAAFVIAGCTSHKITPRRPPASDENNRAFGGRINAGSLDRIKQSIASKKAPYYVPAAFT
jgi:hypothetical protein